MYLTESYQIAERPNRPPGEGPGDRASFQECTDSLRAGIPNANADRAVPPLPRGVTNQYFVILRVKQYPPVLGTALLDGESSGQYIGSPMKRTTSTILEARHLDFVWDTLDPFLFCVHHHDHYPAGNDRLGPRASLAGRNMGMDFEGIDGWRMYHGQAVPGFPQHPHRGFETVTIVRQGYIDHSDSLGATARFGQGDIQWLTTGRGIVHCEMFPLLEREGPNPVELFQIWLNLPAADKFAAPYFSMYWSEHIQHEIIRSREAPGVKVTVYAGAYGQARGVTPPPESWAARKDANLAIWTIRLEDQAQWTLPAVEEGTGRMLYFFSGEEIEADGARFQPPTGLRLREGELQLRATRGACELLLLQGRPIGEPVAQHGPFVMNSPQEIQEAFLDYRRTGFGGWPWPSDEPVHPRTRGRFARHPDGRIEEPPGVN